MVKSLRNSASVSSGQGGKKRNLGRGRRARYALGVKQKSQANQGLLPLCQCKVPSEHSHQSRDLNQEQLHGQVFLAVQALAQPFDSNENKDTFSLCKDKPSLPDADRFGLFYKELAVLRADYLKVRCGVLDGQELHKRLQKLVKTCFTPYECENFISDEGIEIYHKVLCSWEYLTTFIELQRTVSDQKLEVNLMALMKACVPSKETHALAYILYKGY